MLDFVTPDGIAVCGDMRDVIVRTLYFEAVWEAELARFLRQWLRPGDVFVDAGSNFGYFSVIAARLVGEHGRVYAIDASPENFRRLEETLRRNAVANVICRHAAVSDRCDRITIFQADVSNSGASTTVGNPADLLREGASIGGEVEAFPLPDLISAEDLARVSLIKVDVEGAEALVLDGLLPALPRLPRRMAIVIELNRAALREAGRRAADLLQPFQAAGFQLVSLPTPEGAMTGIADLEACWNRFGTADVVLQRDE
jgi:FkbM family methyltransferase